MKKKKKMQKKLVLWGGVCLNEFLGGGGKRGVKERWLGGRGGEGGFYIGDELTVVEGEEKNIWLVKGVVKMIRDF